MDYSKNQPFWFYFLKRVQVQPSGRLLHAPLPGCCPFIVNPLGLLPRALQIVPISNFNMLANMHVAEQKIFACHYLSIIPYSELFKCLWKSQRWITVISQS